MRVVKYQRVSTQSQEVENQTDSIDRQIELLGWDTVGEYKEIVSGTKSRDCSFKIQEKESLIESSFIPWID
jgi:DNA invertase Pin-like site-specific DNA recombinase